MTKLRALIGSVGMAAALSLVVHLGSGCMAGDDLVDIGEEELALGCDGSGSSKECGSGSGSGSSDDDGSGSGSSDDDGSGSGWDGSGTGSGSSRGDGGGSGGSKSNGSGS